MGSKRSHEDLEGSSPEPDVDSPTHSDGDAGPSAKRQRHDTRGKHKAKEGTIEYSKKRARAIERLFQKNYDLDANVRNDLERELASHRAIVSDKAFQKKRSAMISKYHMVRFFERKKAARLAKQLRKKIGDETDPKELERLQRQLHIAEVDEAYAINHPHAEAYISIYGKSKTEKDDDTPVAKAALDDSRPPLWPEVEKAMQQGPDALRNLRERRPAQEVSGPSRPKGGSAPTIHPTRIKNHQKDEKKTTTTSQKSGAPAAKDPKKDANKTLTSHNGRGDAKAPQMNRRERRKLMREQAEAAKDADDGEDFFEAA